MTKSEVKDFMTLCAYDTVSALQASISACAPALHRLAEAVIRSLNSGGKVLICGNGGSAADAQHIAAEFVNRFRFNRPALAAIALTTDTSILTSVANDFDYHNVFARQVEALAQRGDVIIGISTSGNSSNVIAALEQARKTRAIAVGLTGENPGKMKELCDILLSVPSSETPRIQEVHIFLAHCLCDLVEKSMFQK